MTFNDLGLQQTILDAIAKQGYTEPTEIQKQTIPYILEGKDVLAAAQTGTGKTAGFTLPVLEKLSQTQPQMKKQQIRVLVLTPTRELAAQVHQSFEAYGQGLSFKTRLIFGGVGINPQLADIRRGVDIIVATPGRLLDILSQKALDLNALEYLILDEADRMLDMGFLPDIKRILSRTPKNKQTMLFSATFSSEIKTLAKTFLLDPVLVEVGAKNSTVSRIAQVVHPVEKSRKRELLSQLIKGKEWQQVLVFTRTKHGANKLCKMLEESGIPSKAIHGNKSQGARTSALEAFKQREIRVLVATDIAARGLDIAQLPHVVNFELPNIPEDYVHRIGRTGRAGANGEAVSLVSEEERELLVAIEKFTASKIPVVEIPAFLPPKNSSKSSHAEKKEKVPAKQKRKRKVKSKETLAAEVGSKMLEKLDKYEKNQSKAPQKRARRR